jgi:hypothetical protein
MLAAAGLALALASAIPASAHTIMARHGRTAAPEAISGSAGFLHWAPGTDPATTFNSTGGPVSVTTIVPGENIVTFAGVEQQGGNVQVSTPITDATCTAGYTTVRQVAGTTARPGASPPQSFAVNCYDQNGTQTDEPFDLLVTHAPARPAGVLDYATVVPGVTGNLSKNLKLRPFEFNSAGKANSVAHLGTGRYLMTMPGSGAKGNSKGTVKVSPLGSGPGTCQTGAWTATKTAQKITVLCFGQSGAPQNREFSVSYARGNNLMGRAGLTDANASIPAAGANPVVRPATQFDSNRGASITSVHVGPGQYVVIFAGSTPTGRNDGGNGNIQVTTLGGAARHCGYTVMPTHAPELDVNCAGPSGILKNAAFTVQWVTN